LWIGWVERVCGEDWKCEVGSAARPVQLPAGRHYSAFCENVLALIPVLWRFAVTEGAEPRNKHAERLLRRGALWRNYVFGRHTEAGCRFVERLLTVVQSCRLQGRAVLRYLYEALLAHCAGLPSPSVLSAQ
jgi:transposase